MSRNDQCQSGLLPTIVLDFHCPTAMASSDLRINVNDLVRLTYPFRTPAMLSVQVRSDFENLAHNHEFNFTVAEIRRKCIIIIGSSIDQHPERLLQDCPEIWMNGKGSIIDAVYPSQNGAVQDTFSNPYAYADTATTTAMGIYYARSLETCTTYVQCFKEQRSLEPGQVEGVDLIWEYRYQQSKHRHNDKLNKDNTLQSMWISLCDLDWPLPGSYVGL
jgi:hypothetical protein